jgi:GTP cyclohydrolase II
VLLYVRGDEGRGIGLTEKVRAYRLQDRGYDTVEANLLLGHAADAREYRAAAEVLRDLGVRSAALMTNNPDKCEQLERHGVRVARRLPLEAPATPANVSYLRAKRARMGHLLAQEAAG